MPVEVQEGGGSIFIPHHHHHHPISCCWQTFKFRAITSADFRAYTTVYFAEGRHKLPRVSHRGVPAHVGTGAGGFDPADIAMLSALPGGEFGHGVTDAAALAAAKAHAVDLSTLDWDAWYYGVGGPPLKNVYDGKVRHAVDAHADAWVADRAKAAAEGPAVTAGWRPAQWIAFLERLVTVATELAARTPKPALLAPSLLAAIDGAYHLAASRNAELRHMWSVLCLRSGVASRIPDVEDFLASQGRMKVGVWVYGFEGSWVCEASRLLLGSTPHLSFAQSARRCPVCRTQPICDLHCRRQPPSAPHAAL